MNVTALIYDNANLKLYDVSRVVFDITVDTQIFDQPGKCSFSILKLGSYSFEEGATFALTVDGFKVFKGYVFKRTETQDTKVMKVVCYDALYYLQNKDSKVFEGLTSAQILTVAASDLVLPINLRDISGYQTNPVSHDNASYFEMVKQALDETLTYTKEYYIIRDNFGVIEHVNVLNLRAPFMVTEDSNIYSFSFETSIDSNTYNQIKLYRDNDDTGKREIFIVNDTAVNNGENIRKWGILQNYESVDENLNTAQVEELAFKMLSLYNNTKKSIKLSDVKGFLPMSAGYVFPCQINSLQTENIYNWLLCTDCTHKFSGDIHTMSITAEVVNSEWG